jgi:hypothetical protein
MARRGQHVVPHPEGWAVKVEGGKRASSVHQTQREAIDRAREIASNQGAELSIHGRDGVSVNPSPRFLCRFGSG